MKQRTTFTALIVAFLAIAAYLLWAYPTQLGLDLVGGVRGVYGAYSQSTRIGAPEKPASPAEMQQALSVIVNRVNKLGVSEALVQQKGDNQVIVELPLSASARARHLTADQAEKDLQNVMKPAFLEFVELPESIHVGAGLKNLEGEETYIFSGPNGPMTEDQALRQAKVILTGKDLLPDAAAGFDPAKQYQVTLEFDSHGADVFDEYTASHVKKFFGIVLDQKLISYPIINEEIPGGHAEISGGFPSLDDAQHLATLLNAGALPVKLKELQLSSIQATLGAQAVHTSIWAGLTGLALVIIFMWLYYRLPGLLASLALLIYAVYTFAIFKAIPVTLTLPGIAGFILSVGMAVDANILIFERMKEEIRTGKTLRGAIDAGFNRAMTAIIDSNACTLISCCVLGYYGTGPVKGFAVTLAIGVLVSLFTAVTVTRTLLHYLDDVPSLQKQEYFGISVQWMGKWAQGRDIIGGRAKYYLLSGLVIVPGLIFLIMGGLHRGVDFTGGNEWIVQSSRYSLTDTKMAAALSSAGVPRNHYDLEIGKSLQNNMQLATVHSKPGVLNAGVEARALDDLKTREGIADAATASNEHIDPLIGKELELNALKAILIASILIVLYVSIRFAGEAGVKDGFKYGVCAIAAMLHDVFVVVGLFAIFGFALGIEVDMNFVTALLTIIGFSVHDTIVIFDRVRENLRLRPRGETFHETYNKSIVQTAARSINTSFTVILVLVALVLFGAPVIRWFNIALLVGIISGTYSSIFNASPLVVDWEIIRRRRDAAQRGGRPAPAEARPMVSGTQSGSPSNSQSGSPRRTGVSTAPTNGGGAPRRTPTARPAGTNLLETPSGTAVQAPDDTVADGADTALSGATPVVRPAPGSAPYRPAPRKAPPTRRKQRF